MRQPDDTVLILLSGFPLFCRIIQKLSSGKRQDVFQRTELCQRQNISLPHTLKSVSANGCSLWFASLTDDDERPFHGQRLSRNVGLQVLGAGYRPGLGVADPVPVDEEAVEQPLGHGEEEDLPEGLPEFTFKLLLVIYNDI